MDIQRKIACILQEQGYEKWQTYLSGNAVYVRFEQRIICAVAVFTAFRAEGDEETQSESQKVQSCNDVMDAAEEIAQRFHCSKGDVHILSLIICDRVTRSLREAEDPYCWIIDRTANKLLVYEDRASDFYGLRRVIEQGLTEEDVQSSTSGLNKRTISPESQKLYSETVERLRKVPVTVALLITNVIIFLLCAFWPDTAAILYGTGMLQASAVLQQGEYWRAITSMFLHADTAHLFSNMIMLLFVGEGIERIMGSLHYLLLYLLSGLLGNALSLAIDVAHGANGMSLGASGAVFGVMGAMLLLVFVQRRRFQKEVVLRVALGVGCCLYNGFVTAGINNAAHVGGMAGGFLCCGIWLLCKRKNQRRVLP